MTITITVADIRPPAEGKKQGSVIDSTGKRWGVWKDKIGDFKQFATYDVLEFDTNEFMGKTYYTIKKFVLKSEPVSSGVLIPAVGASYTPPDQNRTRMDIFVCGAFNNIMANPNVQPFDMTPKWAIAVINTLKEAWKATLGPDAKEPVKADPISTGNADMNNDSIPF